MFFAPGLIAMKFLRLLYLEAGRYTGTD